MISEFPFQNHSRQEIVKAYIAVSRSNDGGAITATKLIDSLGGSQRPPSYFDSVIKVVHAVDELISTSAVSSINDVSVSKIRKAFPELGGNSGSIQEILHALRDAAVQEPIRDEATSPLNDHESSIGGEGAPNNALMAKIGAHNAMLVSESIRSALSEEREAGDKRLSDERVAGDKRVKDAIDQNLILLKASKVEAAKLSEYELKLYRSKMTLWTTVLVIISTTFGIFLGHVISARNKTLVIEPISESKAEPLEPKPNDATKTHDNVSHEESL